MTKVVKSQSMGVKDKTIKQDKNEWNDDDVKSLVDKNSIKKYLKRK